MSLKIIYLLTVLFSFTPNLIKKTIFQIKLSKEGYNYIKNNNPFIDDIKDLLTDIICSLIPIYNIKDGIYNILDLIFIKYSYSIYKIELVLTNKIYLNEESDFYEFKRVILSFLDILELNIDNKLKFDKITELLSLYENAIKNNCNILDDFYKMNIDEKYDYLENNNALKNRSKSYDEMSTKEKIDYLRSKKDDILNNSEDKEKELKRKK